MAMKSEDGYTTKSEIPLSVAGYLIKEDFVNLYLGDEKHKISFIVNKKYLMMVEDVTDKVQSPKEEDEFERTPPPKDPLRFN
jgi:hypothetical protein